MMTRSFLAGVMALAILAAGALAFWTIAGVAGTVTDCEAGSMVGLMRATRPSMRRPSAA